jgi:AraC-like DNA-binding protein
MNVFFSEEELSLEFLGIFKIIRDKSEQKSLTQRGYDSLSIRLQGRGFFETDNGSITVSPGDILYIPRNAKYSQRTEGETILAIHFVNYSFEKNSKIETLTVSDREYMESILCEMYDIWKEQARGYRYRCVSLLYSLLYYLNSQAENIRTDIYRNKKLSAAIEYIHANYRTEQINVSALATMCAVSETYFRRLFNEIYKISPSQYVINLKLEFASQLLRSRLYTVSEASEKSGFADCKYFCRIFKKHYGISPAKFRDKIPEKVWR